MYWDSTCTCLELEGLLVHVLRLVREHLVGRHVAGGTQVKPRGYKNSRGHTVCKETVRPLVTPECLVGIEARMRKSIFCGVSSGGWLSWLGSLLT